MQEIKRLNHKNYKDVFELSQFAFQYALSEEELEKKSEEADRHEIWGWMEGNELAGKLHIIPLTSYINGRPFKMGGISSVATWPSYRRKGIVKYLLKHALGQMKENGQTISFLSPFSIAFYCKYGWELTFNEKRYNIPMERLKQKWQTTGDVRRIQKDISLLHRIYTTYAKQYTGMIVRDEKWWQQRVLKDPMQIVVAYNEANEEEGYLIYKVQHKILTVKEFVFTSLNGRKLLLEFIANHDSMANEVHMTMPENDLLPLLLDEPMLEQQVNPYFMARIVDVFTFLQQYPFEKVTDHPDLAIHVHDEFFPENSGTYQLITYKDGVNVSKIPEKAESSISCSIQALSTLFLGYKRPMELYELDLIQGERSAVKKLEHMIPKQQTFLADYY